MTAKYLANLTSNQPAPPKLPKITGTRYATATLNIRSTYDDKYTLDRGGAARDQAQHHRRGQERPDADRLREGRPLGDRQVPLEVGAELNATELAGGRERAQAECDQGASRSAGEVPADHDVLHLAGRPVHRPSHRSGTRSHDPQLQVGVRKSLGLQGVQHGPRPTPKTLGSTT